MKEKNELLFELYRTCFPGNIRSEETVKKLLALPENLCFLEEAEGKPAAGAVVNGNTVLLLCVLPEYRRQGLGAALLEKCESTVKQNSFTEIQFCNGPGYITPGIPMIGGNEEFFVKRGYEHSWGDCECVDMTMDLADFSLEGFQIGDALNGVTYDWAALSDRERVTDCVERAHPEFVKYYRAEELYNGAGPERVLMAACGGAVCGALRVGSEVEFPHTGSAGCTAVHPEFRRRRIGTNLVKLGTGYLKELGLAKSFIGYTYTDIVPLYANSGYEISMRYFMGKKELP